MSSQICGRKKPPKKTTKDRIQQENWRYGVRSFILSDCMIRVAVGSNVGQYFSITAGFIKALKHVSS